MRGDGPIRSAMGSLRRGDGTGTGTLCGGRVTEWVALMSMTRGPPCSAGFGAASAVFCTVGLATNGAGRAPDCRKAALTTIRMVAAAAPRMAKESTGRPVTCVHSREPNATASVPARALLRLLSLRRSRTFLHRVCRLHGAGRLIHGDDDRTDHARAALFHRPRPLAIERQADGDAGALADPAADREFAAMQPHQAFDDGQPQTRAAMAAVVGGAGLEIRLADPRQILVADADATVLDHEGDVARLGAGADQNLAAAVGEAERVRQQIEHDLVERTLVGNDLRQIAGHQPFEPDARLARPQRQDVATAGDDLSRIERLRHDLEIVGLDFRHVEYAVDDRQQMIAGIVDQAGIFIAPLG